MQGMSILAIHTHNIFLWDQSPVLESQKEKTLSQFDLWCRIFWNGIGRLRGWDTQATCKPTHDTEHLHLSPPLSLFVYIIMSLFERHAEAWVWEISLCEAHMSGPFVLQFVPIRWWWPLRQSDPCSACVLRVASEADLYAYSHILTNSFARSLIRSVTHSLTP